MVALEHRRVNCVMLEDSYIESGNVDLERSKIGCLLVFCIVYEPSQTKTFVRNHNILYMRSLLRTFALHSYILLADSEGPDQTDLGLRCPHMPEDTFSHDAANINN